MGVQRPGGISNNPDFLSLLKFHVPLAWLFFFLRIKQKQQNGYSYSEGILWSSKFQVIFTCTSILSQGRIAMITLAGKHVSGVFRNFFMYYLVD